MNTKPLAKSVNGLQNINIPEPEFKTIGGYKTAYKVYGRGKPIFCLPPWSSSSIAYMPIANAIGEYRKFIAVDFPGWGGYSDNPEIPLGIDELTEFSKEFILSFKYDEYDTLGLSYGGVVLQNLLHDKTISPKKTVLVSTFSGGDDVTKDRRFPIIKRIYPNVKRAKGKPVVIFMKNFNYLGLLLKPYFPSIAKTKVVHELLEEASQCGLGASLAALVETTKIIAPPIREDIDYQVIYSKHDHYFIIKQSNEIAAKLNIKPEVIDGVDHRHLFFDTDASSQTILDFLESY